MMRVILSGGGTGGHIYPAIAVADALKARQEDVDILFVGAEGKMEMEVIPRYGYEVKGLPIRGVQRRLTWNNLKVPFLVVQSLKTSSKILKEFAPHVVAGFGGYASAPVVYMAQKKGLPTLLQEQNSHAGWANRLLGKRADRICVSYPGMERFFPEGNIQMTGNPVREALPTTIVDSIPVTRRDQYKKTILIIGGSLGAKTLNEAMRESTALWQQHDQVYVIWQCGKRYYDSYKDCETAQLDHVDLRPFIQDMRGAYETADLVISRAGALSISELALFAKAAVLVPSPNVAEDHQTMNARSLVDADAAWMIKDEEATERLVQFALDRVQDEEGLKQKRKNVQTFSPKGAAHKIAGFLLEMAESKG